MSEHGTVLSEHGIVKAYVYIVVYAYETLFL